MNCYNRWDNNSLILDYMEIQFPDIDVVDDYIEYSTDNIVTTDFEDMNQIDCYSDIQKTYDNNSEYLLLNIQLESLYKKELNDFFTNVFQYSTIHIKNLASCYYDPYKENIYIYCHNNKDYYNVEINKDLEIYIDKNLVKDYFNKLLINHIMPNKDYYMKILKKMVSRLINEKTKDSLKICIFRHNNNKIKNYNIGKLKNIITVFFDCETDYIVDDVD